MPSLSKFLLCIIFELVNLSICCKPHETRTDYKFKNEFLTIASLYILCIYFTQFWWHCKILFHNYKIWFSLSLIYIHIISCQKVINIRYYDVLWVFKIRSLQDVTIKLLMFSSAVWHKSTYSTIELFSSIKNIIVSISRVSIWLWANGPITC